MLKSKVGLNELTKLIPDIPLMEYNFKALVKKQREETEETVL